MTLADAPFRPGWALSAQAGAAVAIVLALAGWQASRALEKGALAEARVERLRAAPVAAAEFLDANADFMRVALRGVYDAERQFLVADRRGRGEQVFTPLVAEEGVFLVNRGWIASGVAATAPAPSGVVEVVAVAWPSAAVTRRLAEEPWPEGWPKRVRGVHVERMAAVLNARPRELRLAGGEAGAFRPASLAWDYSTGMHWGYVAQWLAIGAALIGGFVMMGKRRGLRLVVERERADG